MKSHMDEVTTRIFAAYPTVFEDSGCWFDCPPGWEKLVTELALKLTAEYPEARCGQCKSKFGGLRFTLEPGASAGARALVREYQEKSVTICERCGKPGKTISRKNWLVTACPEHVSSEELR